MKKIINIEDFPELIGTRIDKIIAANEEKITRSKVEKMIENNLVFINDSPAKGSYKVRKNDVISYEIVEDQPIELKPLESELDIVYEDDDVFVINKPRGLVVHPSAGHYDDTLVNILIAKTKNLSSINGDFRPGIVHRIDKDTSGLLLIAKNDFAHAFLAEQLKDHSMHREYYAIVDGIIREDNGKIIAPIGRDQKYRQKMTVDIRKGKDATTFFKVIERYDDKTLVSLQLETGRTHQIRVHMAYIGHPVLGDEIYGRKKQNLGGQILHAYKLTFVQPTTKKEVVVEIDTPKYFKEVISKLSV